jgi:hypothetical protein
MSAEGKWTLEVYRATLAGESYVETFKFESLPQLRIALASIADRRFIVKMPANATTADRKTLLDMRARGFQIRILPSGNT